MKLEFDITPQEFEIVHQILIGHLPKDCQVWVFGSRAKFQTKFNSDLDLALSCKGKLDKKVIYKLKDEFTESDLPYTVDVLDIEAVESYFQNIIHKHKILFPFKDKCSEPQLRFPEFSEDWDEKKLSELSKVKFSNGVFNDPQKKGRGYKLINVKDMYEGSFIQIERLTLLELNESEFLRNKANYGDLFFTRSSLVKEGIAYSNINLSKDENITYDGHLVRMRPNQYKMYPQFLNYLLKTSLLRKQLIVRGKTTTMTTIGQEDIASAIALYPSLPEQQKIAQFLTTVDTKVEQLSKKQSLLEQYKKGISQKLFNQEIRFHPNGMSSQAQGKDDDITERPLSPNGDSLSGSEYPDWVEKKLGDTANRSTIKNRDNKISSVLTNSATRGIINQRDYFDKDIANKNNLDGYYVVKHNDFVYNPRISTSAPVGPIKRNKLGTGVMSPLYTVFSFNDINMEFIENYFSTTYWHRYMFSIANIGARHDRMNITMSDFMRMSINIPCESEQQKIANFLSSIDEKVDQVSKQLAQTKQFKKALLQQMFV